MDRSDYIGGSDAKRILDGEWLDLYLEKIGEKKPEDLSANFSVQLGIFTEKFHIAWLNKYCGFDIVPQAALFRMEGQPAIACHLDGWCRKHDCFVDTKHSNGRASRDSMVDWYQPQMAHYCNVQGTRSGIISYIAGNQPPDWFRIEPSQAYREALLEMELAFWWHVANREPPQIIPPSVVEATRIVKAQSKLVMLDGMRAVDMTSNNQWATLAVDYQLNQPAAVEFERAKKGLKEMVEADVRQASGHGVTIKRSKTGSLLFSET